MGNTSTIDKNIRRLQDCIPIKPTRKQAVAIKKLCKEGDYHIVLHAYDSGTLLVAIKKDYFNKRSLKLTIIDYPVYLVDTKGHVEKTKHLSKEVEHDFFDKTFHDCKVILSDNQLYLSYNSFDILGKYLTLPRTVSLKPNSRSISLLFTLSYGGIIQIEEIHTDYHEPKEVFTRHVKWKYLDEVVKRDLLPLDPEIIRKVQLVLSKYLVTNVTGLVVSYLNNIEKLMP